MDILFQYDSHTNILLLQPQTTPGLVVATGTIDSPLNRSVLSLSPILSNIDMIDQLIDSLVLSQQLKSLAALLSYYTEL